MVSGFPFAFLVSSPDNDALIVRPRNDSRILPAAASPRRELGSECLHISWPRASCVDSPGSSVPPFAVASNLARFDSFEILGIHRLCFYLIFDYAEGQITKPSLHGSDQVCVATQLCDFQARHGVKDTHFIVAATTDNSPSIKLNARDSLIMCRNSLCAQLVWPIPNLDMSVAGYRDNGAVSDLDSIDSGTMSFQTANQGIWLLDR
jgi:hypothetical protein